MKEFVLQCAQDLFMVTFPLYVYVYEQCTTKSIARINRYK